MKFKSGKPKTGGRSKGQKNKKTLILDTFSKVICEDGMEKFQAEIKSLKGKDYVIAYMTMYEYVKPKLSRSTVESNITLNKPIIIDWSDNDKADT